MILCTVSKLNDIFKYANDTTLVVFENTDVDIRDEFEHIKAWAVANN